MNFKKIAPYLYFAGAIFLMVSAIDKYSQDLDQYRMIFGIQTEDKNTFLVVRIAVVVLIISMGVGTLIRNKKES